jgi:hypothetical protein
MNPVPTATHGKAHLSVVILPSAFFNHAGAGILTGIGTRPITRTRTRARATGTGTLASPGTDTAAVRDRSAFESRKAYAQKTQGGKDDTNGSGQKFATALFVVKLRRQVLIRFSGKVLLHLFLLSESDVS